MSGSEAVEVRAARDDDLPALHRIAVRCLDRERVHRAGIVDLLYARPGVDPRLSLVAAHGEEVLGFAFASVPPWAAARTGYLDAWAVSPQAQGRGVGGALLTEVESRLVSAGCRWAQMGGNTWFYAWPGIDLAYTAALVAAERAGFIRQSLAHNMDVDLTTWLPDAPRGEMPVRRAQATDGARLRTLVAAHFDSVWQRELDLALARPLPTVHLAEQGGDLVGFAAHGVYRADLFGPLGTAPSQRGSGVGRSLLSACLGDMAAAGLPVAQIGWIGPARFYSRAAGARIGRTFSIMGKAIGGGASGTAP